MMTIDKLISRRDFVKNLGLAGTVVLSRHPSVAVSTVVFQSDPLNLRSHAQLFVPGSCVRRNR